MTVSVMIVMRMIIMRNWTQMVIQLTMLSSTPMLLRLPRLMRTELMPMANPMVLISMKRVTMRIKRVIAVASVMKMMHRMAWPI